MRHLFKVIIIISFLALSTSCGSLINLIGDNLATNIPTNSDESNVQAAVTSTIDEINNAASSSTSAAADSASSLIKALVQHRFQCEETEQSNETFSCSNTTGEMSRSVVFTDCALSNSYFDDAELNGSFDNSVTNGGSGFCNGDYIYFDKMVMGKDGENAVHSHETGANGMVRTFTNKKGKEVTITRTASRTITFSDPVDANEDDAAESVDSTVDLTTTIVRTIDDEEVHNMTIMTMDSEFSAKDEDGEDITVTVTKPEVTVTFDETTHRMSQRTTTSGNRIVDHNLAGIRVVFSVVDEGLTHVAGQCDPYSGTLNFTAYEIEDDDTIGEQVGSGSIVYADGEVESSTYEGTSFNVYTRPCS